MQSIIDFEFNEHLKTTSDTINKVNQSIEDAAKICIECFKNGKKILIFGNGGSAADAQHIASELVGRYKLQRNGLPVIALTTDSSVLTSIGNDFGYLNVFSRQIEALANKGDVVIGISTGGTSKNVCFAIDTANKIGCNTIGLSGKGGGEFNSLCDLNLIVPSKNTPRIQEMHILIGHTLCHLIEQKLNQNN